MERDERESKTEEEKKGSEGRKEGGRERQRTNYRPREGTERTE